MNMTSERAVVSLISNSRKLGHVFKIDETAEKMK